jgi:2-phospho-L-lactate/phosphoenolpyruvate guanylyltransferase
MTVAAVIPIKQLSDAKQRLGGLLSAEERTGLFRMMVEDVLVAVEVCPMVDEILVVTSDDEVADLARAYGSRIMQEPENPGLIAAVTAAAKSLASEGVNSMLFLPGDVPMVTAEELEIVLDGFGRSESTEFTIVPASDLGGSNCIACSPPDCMDFGFGEDSFRRHLRIAEGKGIVPTVARLPGIGLDIDTPADLAELAELMSSADTDEGKGTFRYLLENNIIDRMSKETQRINA